MKISKISPNSLNFSLFLIFVFIIFLRSPCTFYLGRSENGLDVFYDYALNNSFLNSLFYVYSEAKYFELWTNFSSIIVSIVPFPSFFVTVYFALIIKILLLFYVFFSNSFLLTTSLYKFLFASFAIYSTAITPEVWLTTLQSKIFFGILSFAMVFQNFSKFDKTKFFLYRVTLIFNGLSSIFSSIFSVIYFFKFINEKNRTNFINFIYSFIPLLINFLIFLYFSLKQFAENDRFVFELEKIFNLIYNIFIRPIFGANLPKFLYGNYNFFEFKFIFLFLIILFSIVFLIYLTKKKDNILNLILISFFVNVILIFLGSQYSDFVGGRYAVIPSIIFLTIFLRLTQIEKKPLFNKFFLVIITISLISGLMEFKYFNPWMILLTC